MVTGNGRMQQIAERSKCLRTRCRRSFDLQVDIGFAPEGGNPRDPVFLLYGLAGPRPIFWRKDSCGRSEFRSVDLATQGARCDSDLGIVPYALVFSGIAAGHHVEPAVFLAKPDGCCDGCTVFAKTDQRDVFLTLDLGRDRHDDIVSRNVVVPAIAILAGGLGSRGATSIAREYAVVLKARHAQMDARSSQAQKTRGGQKRTWTRTPAACVLRCCAGGCGANRSHSA